jgi:glycosyltransferase involved in cell wall biosynthesis
MPAAVDVLLPTCDRVTSLAMTLSGLAAQDCGDMRVVISDQGTVDASQDRVLQALTRILEARDVRVEWLRHLPRRGIAEQRQFLLDQASADAVLYLDDDVYMEPWVVSALLDVLRRERCGFVGAFPTGLSFIDDVRLEQQHVTWWDGAITPEAVEPDSPEWERWQLHRAANLWHLVRREQLKPRAVRPYKVAWVASCVLYDRAALQEAGGFTFWPRLPRYHSGEEVLVQNLIMRRRGGCAIAPAGTYHSELPSTVLNEDERVDGHALDLLPDLLRELQLPVEASR